MEELKVLYQEVANIILPISNFDWEKVVIRFTKDEKNSAVGIFFKIEGKYVFIKELEREGLVDTSSYYLALISLASVVNKIQKVFKDNEQTVWKSMIYLMEKDGECKVNYTYEELDEDMFRDDIVWRYKYLGMVPNESNMHYISGVEQNLIQ